MVGNGGHMMDPAYFSVVGSAVRKVGPAARMELYEGDTSPAPFVVNLFVLIRRDRNASRRSHRIVSTVAYIYRSVAVSQYRSTAIVVGTVGYFCRHRGT